MFASPVGDPPNILVVEDDTGLRELYDIWLQDEYSVSTAPDLTTAYAQLMDPIDVIVLDRHLPEGPGRELLSEVRTLGLDCQVVMLTAVEPSLDIIELSFDDYLQKPVTREELQATLARLLEQKQFRESVVEYNRLKRKLSLLEEHCDPAELAEHDRYATLEARRMELFEVLDSTVTATPDLPFEASPEQVSGD